MDDDERIALLVYTHVVQLTLIDVDVDVDDAVRIAHRAAALTLDTHATRASIDAVRQSPSAEGQQAFTR